MSIISKYFSLCRNFHSKAGMGVNSDMGVISEDYGSNIIIICIESYKGNVIIMDSSKR